jgi:uncharacterized membrane protein
MRPFSYSPTLRIGVLSVLMGLARTGHAESITTFDVPTATSTMPLAINALGRIVGFYYDTNSSPHAFVRNVGGTITSFDAPSAGSGNGQGTIATAINLRGQIAGGSHNVSMGRAVSRGFVREVNGAITDFDATEDAIYTDAYAINLEGWVAGIYYDASYVGHGFLRLPDGAITTFDVPGLIENVQEISPLGEIVGSYLEPNGTMHGFLWKPDGTLTSFDGIGFSRETGGIGCGHCSGTIATAASAVGGIVGYYGGLDDTIHGFFRKANGTMTVLDLPGAIATYPYAINLEGQIAGQYMDASALVHAFLLQRNGTLHTFDVAGSNGMQVTAINLGGQIVGYYTDASYVYHGFVRTR